MFSELEVAAAFVVPAEIVTETVQVPAEIAVRLSLESKVQIVDGLAVITIVVRVFELA